MTFADKLMVNATLASLVSVSYVDYYWGAGPIRSSDATVCLAAAAFALQLVTWIWAKIMLPKAPLWILSTQASRSIAALLMLATVAAQYYSSYDVTLGRVLQESGAIGAICFLIYAIAWGISPYLSAFGVLCFVYEDRL